MFPFLHLLYRASLDNLNSFSSKHLLMTSSQKTKENEKIDQGPGPCCDDSYCGGSIGRIENEERRCCLRAEET
jgi:hypothetical protein